MGGAQLDIPLFGLESSPLVQYDLTTFFESHNRELERFLQRRVGSFDIAGELAQEAYVRLLRMPDREKIVDLERFLFTIANNLARDHLRKRARVEVFERSAAEPPPPDPTSPTEALVEAEQQAVVLQNAIDALPPKAKSVFLLYRIEGRSYKDIAETLGISPRTVEYHIRHALIHCRQRLKDAPSDE